jgi:hypothetical protein
MHMPQTWRSRQVPLQAKHAGMRVKDSWAPDGISRQLPCIPPGDAFLKLVSAIELRAQFIAACVAASALRWTAAATLAKAARHTKAAMAPAIFAPPAEDGSIELA